MHLSVSEGNHVAICCFVPVQLNCIELLSSQVQDELIQTKVTHLWTESLHHVTEKFIKLFAFNIAIICQRIKKMKVVKVPGLYTSWRKLEFYTEFNKWLYHCQMIFLFSAWTCVKSSSSLVLCTSPSPFRHATYVTFSPVLLVYEYSKCSYFSITRI